MRTRDGIRTDVTFRGQATIWADRPSVWRALHDVDVLASCIPGCVALVRTSTSRFELRVEAKAGPVSALLDGQVEITESRPPDLLALRARGRGAPFLEVAGSTRIMLSPCAVGCRALFEVAVEPVGILASFGAQLIAGIAQGQIDQFARSFAAAVGTPPAVCGLRGDLSRLRPPT